jgi:hypothetical protein
MCLSMWPDRSDGPLAGGATDPLLRGGWVKFFPERGQGLLMVIYYYDFGVKYI